MHQIGNKIKILFITSNLGIGGLERVIVQLCTHLDKQIYSPAVCCIHFKGDLSEELQKNDIRVYNLHCSKPDYLAFLKILPVINEFKPHIVHTHNINASIDGIIASVIKRVPVKVHTDHARNFPDKSRYMMAEKIVAYFIEKIIAVTEETRENLICYEKIKKEKISVVNNGVVGIPLKTKVENDTKKAELDISHFNYIIGSILRLELQKGLIFLIRAMPLILRKFPNTGLVIAGQGSQREILEAEAITLDIQQKIKFIGPRLDVCEILNLLDVFVLPSVWEGLPMSLLEAMSCKKPIVATNVGGIPQAIIDGKNGILVQPSSPQSLADAICTMLSNDKMRQKLSLEAYNQFKQKFTVDKMVQAHHEIYQNCLSKKGLIYENTGA